jgi:hypothetical protein
MNQAKGHVAPLSNYGEIRGGSSCVSLNKGTSKISRKKIRWSHKYLMERLILN